MQPARQAIIRPAPSERTAAERPIDAGLRSSVTARRSFVVARTLALIIAAIAALITWPDNGVIVASGFLAAVVLQPLIVRFIRGDRIVEWQSAVDLHLAMFVLVFEPSFLPLAMLWVGTTLAWLTIVTTRGASRRVGALAVVEISAIGVIQSLDGWFVLAVAIALTVALFGMLTETLRTEMWAAESALVDALSAAGAIVHHASLDDGTVSRIEGDLQGITGWTVDEWVSSSHRDFIHPDDIDQYWVDVDSISPDTVVDRVARVRHADGSWVWMRDIARISIDADGRRFLRGFSLDVTELEMATRTLANQARIDILTQLPNRFALTERIDALLTSGQPFALLIMDLDRFKEVNDTLGHEAGDQLLQVMATRLRRVADDADLLARLGGDEFALIVPGVRCQADLEPVMNELVAEGSRPLTVLGIRIAVSISTGVALSVDSGGDRATLMRHADIAMYDAKRQSVAFRVFDESLDRSSTMQLSLSAALPDAIASGQLRLYFQPKYEMATNRIVGAEGLARWIHPEFGLLTPAAFLDITLVSESSVPFALSTIRHTAQMIRRLSDLGLDLPIAANVALGALRTADFASTVLAILNDVGVPHDRLIIELTETDIQGPSPEAVAALDTLTAAGVDLSIDDFGTGHSSLERIRNLCVHELKIDRSFVNGVVDHPVERELVRSVIDLARHLEYRLVAEGVETEEEASRLQEMGCDVAQGYLYARPMPADQFVDLVVANAADSVHAANGDETRALAITESR